MMFRRDKVGNMKAEMDLLSHSNVYPIIKACAGKYEISNSLDKSISTLLVHRTSGIA